MMEEENKTRDPQVNALFGIMSISLILEAIGFSIMFIAEDFGGVFGALIVYWTPILVLPVLILTYLVLRHRGEKTKLLGYTTLIYAVVSVLLFRIFFL